MLELKPGMTAIQVNKREELPDAIRSVMEAVKQGELPQFPNKSPLAVEHGRSGGFFWHGNLETWVFRHLHLFVCAHGECLGAALQPARVSRAPRAHGAAAPRRRIGFDAGAGLVEALSFLIPPAPAPARGSCGARRGRPPAPARRRRA